ncbi:hypothetical protein [Micromonospora sp. NPDC051006]|uniref:hypothetical protein n=1 Tax=Micromonospora sp. NPDC051006 TaxID=3364283 RepID=UPI0037A18DF7
MAWSFGHFLIVVLALLLGLAAGWLLRGRQDARTRGSSITDGDPVAGTAVLASPEPAAVSDPGQAPATVDPAPSAVADPPAPVDTITESAVVSPAHDGPASDVDPADMALTGDPEPTPVIAPRPVPVAERTTPDAPAASDEPSTGPTGATQPAPAVEQPAEPVAASTEVAEPVAADAPAPASPADEPVAADIPAPVSAVEEPVAAETPVPASPGDEPVAAAAEPAGGTDEAAGDPEPAAPAPRPAVATPPVRPVAAAAVEVDDFRRIQGVGPKMAAALQEAGVRTYRQLAELDEAGLRELIRGAGLRAAPGLATWPQQAKVLAGAPDEVVAALPTAGGPDQA